MRVYKTGREMIQTGESGKAAWKKGHLSYDPKDN